MSKKYELVKSDTKEFFGRTLYRVKYLRDGKYFSKGDLGGYIESENNLSQGNDACVSGNAFVYGDARVYSNARVSGDAHVYGNARVYGNACVSGDAHVYGNAWVFGDAHVYGNARVYGNAWVFGDARVSGDAHVYGNAWVNGDVKIDFVLCSRFNFYKQEQIKKWLELEKQFEKELKMEGVEE